MATVELTIQDWDGYAARWSAMHGGFDPRHSVPLVRAWMRLTYVCGRPLARLSISAGALTWIGLLACMAAPSLLLLGPRWALAAAALVLFTMLAEGLDGAVAVIVGRITPLGTVYGAIAARLGEFCWLAALWLAGTPGWLAAAAGAVAWMHEYARAQAMMSGTSPARMATMAERSMRIAVAAIGLGLSGAATLVSPELGIGAATMATTVWVLLGLGGLVQLADAVNHSLR
ncbi:MAG: CDP-alcohol phosphatidyltransferase family protein [Micromonosporaceae bacterium]